MKLLITMHILSVQLISLKIYFSILLNLLFVEDKYFEMKNMNEFLSYILN